MKMYQEHDSAIPPVEIVCDVYRSNLGFIDLSFHKSQSVNIGIYFRLSPEEAMAFIVEIMKKLNAG